MQDINGRYFSRCSIWKWHGNDRIDILDEEGNTVSTLDQWQTMVFFHAEGVSTVESFISRLPTHYADPEALPPDLNQLITKNVHDLVTLGFVNLADEAHSLDDKFDEPRDESNAAP